MVRHSPVLTVYVSDVPLSLSLLSLSLSLRVGRGSVPYLCTHSFGPTYKGGGGQESTVVGVDGRLTLVFSVGLSGRVDSGQLGILLLFIII